MTKYQGSKPHGFRQEDSNKCKCQICDPQGGAFFWRRGHNPQGDVTYQILWLKPYGFIQEDFFMFLPI